MLFTGLRPASGLQTFTCSNRYCFIFICHSHLDTTWFIKVICRSLWLPPTDIFVTSGEKEKAQQRNEKWDRQS